MSSFSVGRSHTNDLQVSNPHVSGHHARLIRDAGGLWIEHTSHTPGVLTYVNGVSISRALVSPGDRIELSHHYVLDWNNHKLVAWLASGAQVEHRFQEPFRAGRPAPRGSRCTVTPSTLWLVLGAFFFVGYFLPIAPGTFFWDGFSHDAMGAVVTLYVALTGMAIIPVAYALRGVSRAITLMSVGFVGLALYSIQTIRSAHWLDSALGGALGVVALLSLTAMLALNNVVIEKPGRKTVRLLAGIAASVYALFLVLVQIGVISLLASEGFDEPLTAVTFAFTVLLFIAMLGATVLVIVNFKKAPFNRGNALLAERIVLIALLVQLLAMSVLFGVGMPQDGGWMLLYMLRAMGFLFGMAVVFGGGLADMLKLSSPE